MEEDEQSSFSPQIRQQKDEEAVDYEGLDERIVLSIMTEREVWSAMKADNETVLEVPASPPILYVLLGPSCLSLTQIKGTYLVDVPNGIDYKRRLQ